MGTVLVRGSDYSPLPPITRPLPPPWNSFRVLWFPQERGFGRLPPKSRTFCGVYRHGKRGLYEHRRAIDSRNGQRPGGSEQRRCGNRWDRNGLNRDLRSPGRRIQYDEQVDPEDLRDTDIKVECGGIAIYVDGETQDYIKGSIIDYMQDEHGRDDVENPNPPAQRTDDADSGLDG